MKYHSIVRIHFATGLILMKLNRPMCKNEKGQNLGFVPKYNPNAPEFIDNPNATKTPDDGFQIRFDDQIKNPDYLYWKKHLENN